jgi:transposase
LDTAVGALATNRVLVALNVHLRAELRACTDARAWLRGFRLPAYAPDLDPVEGIWSVLKRCVLANLALQYQPILIEGCLAGTGLTLERGYAVGRLLAESLASSCSLRS